MPPIPRFTKAEIVAAALNLARREGIAGITARDLGAELGTSSRPIFTAFRNMEEVQRETVLAARTLYNGYVEKGLANEIPFKGVGMQYICFAREEPQLFKLLFMTADETLLTLDNILPVIDDNSDKILSSIQNAYGLSRELAYRLYQNMWVFTHGIACLYATGVSRLTEDEASERLTEVFIGLLINMKSGGKKDD
jgi:AcrR family transcriptional regulator